MIYLEIEMAGWLTLIVTTWTAYCRPTNRLPDFREEKKKIRVALLCSLATLPNPRRVVIGSPSLEERRQEITDLPSPSKYSTGPPTSWTRIRLQLCS